MSARPLVDHVLATGQLGPQEAQMYEYVYGADGVYVRAEREGLKVQIPIAECALRGLQEVNPYLQLDPGRVPLDLVAAIFIASAAAGRGYPKACEEALFYLWHDGEAWRLIYPPQIATATSVRPLDPHDEFYGRALIEVHSHHSMRARFSETDDADEQGFRIYAVVGSLYENPEIAVRVGVYGYFWDIPAIRVFAMPGWLSCATAREKFDE